RRRNAIKATVSQILHQAARGSDAGTLIIAEHEELVLDNGAADRGAELILFEGSSWRSSQIVITAIGVENRVLQNFEKHAVKLVRAGLQGYVDHATGGASVFGVIAVSQNLHVADGFNRRADHKRSLVDEVDDVDVVVDAIQQEIILTSGAHAVCRKVAALRAASTRFSGQNAGGHAREKGEDALSAERKIGDLSRIQVRTQCRTFRLQQRRRSCHLYSLSGFTNLEDEVNSYRCPWIHDYVALLRLLEARRLHRDGVSSGIQSGPRVSARTGRDSIVGYTGRRVCEGDLCIGNRGAGGVRYSSGNRSQISLCKGKTAYEQKREQNPKSTPKWHRDPLKAEINFDR